MKKSILSASQKKEIKRAQDRLRRAPEFVKSIARHQGVSRLTVKGSASEQTLNLMRARYINSSAEYTKRGYNSWLNELADDTRLSRKEIEFILSQIDSDSMDFVQNSNLRYGSNPQLDYVADRAIELKNGYQNAIDEIERMKSELAEDIF